MSSTYEGIPLDLSVPGYSNVPSEVLAASNKIGLVDKQIETINGISKNYTDAFNAYTKEAAFNATTNPRSNDVATYNAAIASNAKLMDLRLKLSNLENIVQKNGGKLVLSKKENGAYASDPKPNFTSVLSKYEKEKEQPNRVLKNAGPEILSKLPPFDAAYKVILKDAVKRNEEKSAPIVAKAAVAKEAFEKLNILTDPNRGAADPGFKESRDPAYVNGVLNRAIGSGGAGAIISDTRALLLAFQNSPAARLSNFPTNSQLQSALNRMSNKQTYPNGPTLNNIIGELSAAGGPKPRTIAKPATGGGFPLPKPAPNPPTGGGFPLPKPAPKPAAVKTPPAKPAPKPAAIKPPPAKPAPKPAAPRPPLPKTSGRGR